MNPMIVCLIIFALTIASYIWGKLTAGTTAILSLVALSLFGCLTPAEALANFGNANVIMIAGMCIVAAGFNRTRFCANLAAGISKIAKGSMTKILFGYVVLGIVLSQFIQSPVVVFGIVAPMALSSAKAANINPSKIIFPLGVAVISTNCILPLGAGATVAAELNGYMENYGYTAHTVSLFMPAIGRVLTIVVALLYCVFLAPKMAPEKTVSAEATAKSGQTAAQALSPFQERAGYIIFILDAVALMFASKLGLANWQITVLGALAMIICGVLKPKDAINSLPMPMLLLIVGSLGMSSALSATGAGDVIGAWLSTFVSAVGGNNYIIGLAFFLLPFVLTQFMQNRATMMIFIPIAIATCASIGGNPIGLMLLVQQGALSAFVTPLATPAVPYMMSYGGYDQKDMLKMSWAPAILLCIVNVIWIMTVFPVL